MPAVEFPERAGDQRRDDHRPADEQVVDLERIRPPQITRRVKGADLTGEVALEASHPYQQAQQRRQKRDVEGHQEVADRHERCAQRDGAGLAEPAIGHDTAGDRRQIDQARVETKDRRGEGDRRQRAAVELLEQTAAEGEAGNVLDVPGQQQLPHHVEHQQRLHAVVGESLPGLGEGEVRQAAWMAEEGVVARGRARGVHGTRRVRRA